MILSKKTLLQEARQLNYKPELYEKTLQLLTVLKNIVEVPYLRNRFVLKGGTALNLFHYEKPPRLSVDIDLNYIGQLDREKMLEERPLIINALNLMCRQLQLEPDRQPTQYAGGKMIWRYNSVLDQKGNLELDLNYMYRKPLWEIEWKFSKLNAVQNISFPILNIHEIAAGKLIALFSRSASRDFFDVHYLLTQYPLNINQLKIAFIVYLAMSDIHLQKLKTDNILYDLNDFYNRLLPVLQQDVLPTVKHQLKLRAERILAELKIALNKLLLFEENELSFIRQIREFGKIEPDLITTDKQLQNRILQQPALQWILLKNK